MLKRIVGLGALALALLAVVAILLPTGISSAQGLATQTPTSSGLGGFLGGTGQTAATPTAAAAGTTDPVKAALAKSNYVVIASGPWYDEAGKPLAGSVHVFMVGVSTDPKSTASVQQIVAGFAALKSQYATATIYHVLLLNGPNVYDATTTANSLQLLSSQIITSDTWVKEVLNSIRTVSLTKGTTAGVSPSVTPAVQATATRVPTRVPTKATTTCNAPADKARLWIKNGYTGVMRFTVGGGEWGTHDFDIPADAQFHYVDMPTGRYTYSASIPGVGKANGERQDYVAGQCYYLTFSP